MEKYYIFYSSKIMKDKKFALKNNLIAHSQL
jgi:hypothetical protein